MALEKSDIKKINCLIQKDKTPFKKRIKYDTAIRERIVQMFKEIEGDITWKEIRDKIHGNKSEIFDTLGLLVKEGILVQVGRGVRGNPYKYSIKVTE